MILFLNNLIDQLCQGYLETVKCHTEHQWDLNQKKAKS